MRSLIVNEKYNNKKISLFLQENFSGLSTSTFYKALRKKDILINGIRIKDNLIVHTGDNVVIYITDNYLFKQIDLKIVYEDENILAINKPSGIEVTSIDNKEETLTSLLQKEHGVQGNIAYTGSILE